MKKVFFLVLLISSINGGYGQLSGVKNIPGDYPTVALAVANLNAQGVGTGGVTFNVAAGYTETAANIVIMTPTSIAGSPIVFQKSGTGPNPLITADAGVGNVDGVIEIQGTDYVTFDGIDVQENALNTTATTFMEWGYGIFCNSATDASKYITIKNCNISLSDLNTTLPRSNGIYIKYQTASLSSSITPTSATGVFTNINISSNSISNVFNGIYAYGNSTVAYYISTLEIGVNGANTISSSGALSSSYEGYGIYVYNANNIKIANNSISGSYNNGCTANGIYTGIGNNSNCDIYSNTITQSGFSIYGIRNATGGSGTNNKINIYNNIIENCTYSTSTTGYFYGIYQEASANNSSIYGNIIRNNMIKSNGFRGILSNGYVKVTDSLFNNQIVNNTCNSCNTDFYGITSAPSSTTNKIIFNNAIYDNSIGGTGDIFGISTNYGDSISIFKNNIYSLSTVGSGGAYGLNVLSGSLVYLYNNLISDLRAPVSNTTSAVNGINIESDAGTTIKAYNNTVFLNASGTGVKFGSSGIYTTTTSPLELKNNIIVNNSTAVGTGITVAYRRRSTTLTSYSVNSDHNLFYAGTPGPKNVIFYDLTNSDQDITAFKTRVTPADNGSFTGMPPFMNMATSPYDLHLQTTIATACESGGDQIFIPSIFEDFDGDIRWGEPGYTGSGTGIDIGADEFNGINGYSCNTPSPGNTISSANNFCPGEATILSLQNPIAGSGVSYQWQVSADGISYTDIPGETNPFCSVTPEATAHYQCIVTCQNGPSAGTSNSVTVNVKPLPLVVLGNDITLCADQSIILDAGNVGGSYLWTPGGAITQAITADTLGHGISTVEYIVIVTVNDCFSSDTINVTFDPCTGIKANDGNIRVSVVPNPSNGMFYLNVEGINEPVTLNIYSINGKVIYSEQVDNTGLVNKPIDLKSYPKGMYFLRLINNNMTHTEKIIIE